MTDDRRPTSLLLRRPHLHDFPPAPTLPDGYALRRATSPDDDAGMAALLTAAFDEPWEIARVQERLTRTPDVLAVYVIEWHGMLVATASSQIRPQRYANTGWVHWVGTHPAHRRKGLAVALLAQLMADFTARGYDDAVLHTQDFRLAAIRAYLAFGFIPIYDEEGDDQRARWSVIFQRIFAGE